LETQKINIWKSQNKHLAINWRVMKTQKPNYKHLEITLSNTIMMFDVKDHEISPPVNIIVEFEEFLIENLNVTICRCGGEPMDGEYKVVYAPEHIDISQFHKDFYDCWVHFCKTIIKDK
jgi:hypothetical protein